MPMKPATPVRRIFIGEKWGLSLFLVSLLFCLVKLDELRVLEVAIHASDRDVQEARHTVEEAQAQHVELEEAHHRREQQVRRSGRLPALESLARLQRGVAVLALEVHGEVVEGFVHE